MAALALTLSGPGVQLILLMGIRACFFKTKAPKSVVWLCGEVSCVMADRCFFALFCGYNFAEGLCQSLCPVCRLQQCFLQCAGAGGQLRASVWSLRHVVMSSMTD